LSKLLKLGVLISGRGSNLEALFKAIDDKKLDAEINVVLSNKPDSLGLEHARKRQVPAFGFLPSEFNSMEDYEEKLIAILKQHQVDCVVLAGYLKLVHKPFLDAFPNKVVNIHPSLLPAFKGLHAPKQALDYGVKIAGCTTHIVVEALDEGPILLQAAVPVLDNDTEETLAARILEQEHILLPKTLQLIKGRFL
jgi:phosphoribosylglycinamide formyltransferase-1